jgi:hypothetical protein
MSAAGKLGREVGTMNEDASIRPTRVRCRRRSGERGSAIIEFAYTLVISFVLIFAIIDFGRALYSYHFVSEAAREGTRFASVRGALCSNSANPCPAQADDIVAFVKTLVPDGIDPNQVNVIPQWPGNGEPVCGTNYPGCPVQVQVTYNFSFIFPFDFYKLPPISFLANSILMSSTSEMIISR